MNRSRTYTGLICILCCPHLLWGLTTWGCASEVPAPPQANSEQYMPGQHTPPQANSEQYMPGQHTPSQANSEQYMPGQHTPPQANAEQYMPGQHTPPQANAEQYMPGQHTPRQTVPKQCVPQRAIAKRRTGQGVSGGCTAAPSACPIGPDSTGLALWMLYQRTMDSAARCERQGRFRAAVVHYIEAFERLKSCTGHSRRHLAEKLEEHYRTGTKEQRVAFLAQTLRLRKTQHLLLLALAIGIAAALAVLFLLCGYRLRCLRLRARHEADLTAIATLTREELELEAKIREAEATRYRRELLAESLLASYKHLVIEELRRLFARTDGLGCYREELEEILARRLQGEEETGTFGTDIRQLHPLFYERLQRQASKHLSSLDLEYCRMIYLGMSTKEMACLLGVEPRTVRVHKYRLKRRLALGKQEDLAEFIRSQL